MQDTMDNLYILPKLNLMVPMEFFSNSMTSMWFFFDTIEQSCEESCVNIPEFFDVHKYDFLVTFTDGSNGSDKVLAQSVQNVNIIGLSF